MSADRALEFTFEIFIINWKKKYEQSINCNRYAE